MAVTDNFNRANGGLGANWTTDSAFTAPTISSNTVLGGTASNHNIAVYTAGGTITADQYAQVKVVTTGNYLGTVLRSNGAGTFYVCFYQPDGTTATSIYKVISGSFTQIGFGSTVTPAANDIVYFSAVGTALTFKVNATTVCTATDSAITGAGYTGIDIFHNGGAAIDDFEGGAIGAVTVTVNLTGVAASPAVGVVGFNVSLPLGSVAATSVIGTGTVTTDTAPTVSVTLTGVAASPAIGLGHVAIEGEVIAPPDQGLVAGGGRWYGLPEDAKVYLTGVAANPQVGKIAAKPRGTLDELYRMYPFPRKVEQRPLPVVRKKAAKPPKPAAFVYMAGVHPTPRIGNVTTKAFYEDNDEELTSMLKMMDVDEDLITALKLSK